MAISRRSLPLYCLCLFATARRKSGNYGAFTGCRSRKRLVAYGRPGKGNDKGSGEGLVGYTRRNFMVLTPRFATWDALNVWLAEQCRKRQSDVLRGHPSCIIVYRVTGEVVEILTVRHVAQKWPDQF